MKRLILCILAIFLLSAGAAMAQTANTTAPGPTVQREPGLVSNNLPNPGNPQTDLSAQQDTYQEPQPMAQEPAVTEPTATETEATGTTDVDTSTTTDTGLAETGTETETDTGALPDTASELPLLMLAGLLALASAFMVRLRRNA